MSRPVCRIEASVYKTLKTTGILAVRPTHRGTKRPAKWPIPVLTCSAPRLCVYIQAGHRGNNMNNLIHIPTNIWDVPSIVCANARSVTNKIDELDAGFHNKCIDIAGITETRLKDDIPSISIQLNGFYPPLRNDRNSRRGGCGVLRATGDTVQTLGGAAGALCWDCGLTIMPKRLPRNISIIIIGVIYHPQPPVKDGPIIAHITRSLELLLQRYPAAGVLLLATSTRWERHTSLAASIWNI